MGLDLNCILMESCLSDAYSIQMTDFKQGFELYLTLQKRRFYSIVMVMIIFRRE